MAELNNRDYYQRRAQHSRELAKNAANPAIARIHLDMAARYEDLASATGAEVNEKRLST